MAIHQQLTNDLTWVGVQDPQLKVFDIIMETEYGTTYNAYLLKGLEKTALIETVKLPFFDEFRKRIEAVLPITQIDYLIVNHTEPDHAGSIARLLEINPELTVVGSPAALQFLKEIVNQDFRSLIAKEGMTLDPGRKDIAVDHGAESALAGYDVHAGAGRRDFVYLRFLRCALCL